MERNAAAYAMSVMEQVARETHAHIAPRITVAAGSFLNEVTDGNYEELYIDNELNIGVRIPQTKKIDTNPQKLLSTGTVDQIYFALRLSLVQCMSDKNESIPMLLDDPFANYDDDRLQRTMNILAKASKNNQMILFTCRDDVVSAARNVDAEILEL